MLNFYLNILRLQNLQLDKPNINTESVSSPDNEEQQSNESTKSNKTDNLLDTSF